MTDAQKNELINKWIGHVRHYEQVSKTKLNLSDEELKERMSAALDEHEVVKELMKPHDARKAAFETLNSNVRERRDSNNITNQKQRRMIRYYYEDNNDTFNDMFDAYVNTPQGANGWNLHMLKNGLDHQNLSAMTSFTDMPEMINHFGDDVVHNAMFLFGTDDEDALRSDEMKAYIALHQVGIQAEGDCHHMIELYQNSPESAILASLKLSAKSIVPFMDSIVVPENEAPTDKIIVAQNVGSLAAVGELADIERSFEKMGKDAKTCLMELYDMTKKPMIKDPKTGKLVEITKSALCAKLVEGPVEYQMVDDSERAAKFQMYLKTADQFQQVYDIMKTSAKEINETAPRAQGSFLAIRGAKDVIMKREHHWYRGSSNEYKAIESGLASLQEKLENTDMLHASAEELAALKADYTKLIADAGKYIEDRHSRENMGEGYKKTRYENVKAVKALLENECQQVNTIYNARNRVKEAMKLQPLSIEVPVSEELITLTEKALNRYMEQSKKIAQVLEKSNSHAASTVKELVKRLSDPKQKADAIEALAKTDLMKEIQKNPELLKDDKVLHQRFAEELGKIGPKQADSNANVVNAAPQVEAIKNPVM